MVFDKINLEVDVSSFIRIILGLYSAKEHRICEKHLD